MSNAAIEKLKEQIIAAIANASDPNLKAILLLLMHTQTTMIFEAITEINSKADGVWLDEKSLRETVPNGHAKSHDERPWMVAGRRGASARRLHLGQEQDGSGTEGRRCRFWKMKFGIRSRLSRV